MRPMTISVGRVGPNNAFGVVGDISRHMVFFNLYWFRRCVSFYWRR